MKEEERPGADEWVYEHRSLQSGWALGNADIAVVSRHAVDDAWTYEGRYDGDALIRGHESWNCVRGYARSGGTQADE